MTTSDTVRKRSWAAGGLALAQITCLIGAPGIAAAEQAVQAEKNPPGDIPDNQVFVSYRSRGRLRGRCTRRFSWEGWTRVFRVSRWRE